MGKIILRLDRVMADRKMSLNELSELFDAFLGKIVTTRTEFGLIR